MAEGRLAGQIVLVTGASSGIGRAIALGFARAGADVIVHHRTRTAEADAVATEIRALGQRAQVVRGDITSAAEVGAFMAEAEALGSLTIAVCNAGTHRRVPFLDLDEEMWDWVVDTDLKGPFLVAQAAARQMVATGVQGRIIATSSISAHARAIASKGMRG